jgi:hypothetical protein
LIFKKFVHMAVTQAQSVTSVQGSPVSLSEAHFWQLIAALDWSKPGDEGAAAEPLVAALASRSVADIHRFQDILSEKLWHLDTEAHALASLGEAQSKRLSADYFLYDRCYVVAQGRAFYEKVLHRPVEFPVGKSFEELLHVASMAYGRKTGEPVFLHTPAYDYETYSNENGWAEP